MIALILLGFFAVLFCVVKYVHTLRRWKVLLKDIPEIGPSDFVLGHVRYFDVPPEELFRRLDLSAKKFYPLNKIRGAHVMGVFILSPEDAELVLSNPAHNEKGWTYIVFHKWLKSGLLTSKGSKWQTRRKILTPAFHFNILQQFVVIFNEEAEKFVEILKTECQKSYVNVTPLIGLATLKMIAETAMGTKLQFHTKKDTEYKDAVHEIGRIMLYKYIHPWVSIIQLLNPLFFRELSVLKTLHRFTRDLIDEREKNFADFELPTEEHDVYKGKRRLAMLDLLLSIKRKEGLIDSAGIQEEVDTFTFEGHDTVSAALGFVMMLISCHKDVQDRIVDEMREVLTDVHKKPTYNDLQNLKFLERCIKESLRLYPSVYFLTRALGEDLQTHSGPLLPKGMEVGLFVYAMHRNENIYPDPETFDPDRFLPENSQNRHPFAYLPFSAGPRNCIGQRFAMLELKVVICAILANFVLEPIDTPETIVLTVDVILRTKEGIKIRFVPRSQD